jgi:hypothetical protein
LVGWQIPSESKTSPPSHPPISHGFWNFPPQSVVVVDVVDVVVVDVVVVVVEVDVDVVVVVVLVVVVSST